MKLSSRFARHAPAALVPLTLYAFALPVSARPPVPMAHPAPGARLKWDSKKFMRVSELRPGMKGYALTVFRGTKIEKFNIEILGVMAKFNEGKDYILFRALDGPSVTRSLGIAHGMSGSPIYINGRLIGAISMGIPGTQFAREPIALATPIEDMLEAWNPDLPQKPSDMSASAPTAATGASASGMTDTRFQPIGMPLMVSGLGSHSMSRLRGMMAPYHFDVMAGGGGALSSDSLSTNPLAQGATLQPGSAVGVSLVQGDVDYTATGTVTYRDGKRLLLFGHPFTSLGPIDAAMTTAYVVSIFPSYQDSVKLGSPIKTVGRIFQDRPFSVGGVIGPMPQMVPMTVSVNDLSLKRHKDFHVRIINHPLLTGQFVSQVAGAVIEQIHGQPGDSMATVSLDVDAEEIGHIKRTNTFYDASAIDQSATGDLDSLMRLLSSNPFYPLAVKSVKMSVTIQNRHDTAEIDHLFLTQSKFAPGDTVDVGVVLKPYKRPLYTRMVPIKIPQNTADGTLTLNVQGGGTAGGGGITSLLGGLLQIRASEPVGSAVNVAQLVKQFNEKPRNNQLVTRLLLPTSALSIKGEKLTDLPPNLAAAMQSSRTTGLKTERDEVKETQTLPYVLSGSQSLSITVRRRDLMEAPAPLPSAAPTASPLPISASEAPAPSPLSNNGDDGDDSDDAARLMSPTGFVLFHRRPLMLAAASTKPSDTKPVPAPAADAPEPPKPAVVKPVGRLASVWHQGTQTDFAAGNLTNVAVTSTGDVRLAPSLRKLADTTQNYVWSILPDGHGNLYLGTGDNGAILKMDGAGKVTTFFKTGELEVTSLAFGPDGLLIAGTAPHGVVFQITPDGKGSKALTATEKYVTALTVSNPRLKVDGDGMSLYIATGGGVGRIYKTSFLSAFGQPSKTFSSLDGKTGKPTPFFTSPEAHLLSLATDKDGTVYAGSSPNGIVYKITPDGKSTVLYDAAEPNITALTVDKDGAVYAGTGPTGTVYRISPDGTAKRMLGKLTTGITGLQSDADGAVYAAAGGTVTKINPDDTTQSFVAPEDQQFVSLALDPSTGAVYTGTGVVGSVYAIGAFRQTAGQTNTLEGKYQSVVHDAGIRAKWGTLTWGADTPSGAGLQLQTRSGDVPRPDASWSEWSAPLTLPAGQTVTSPPARYIQYQAVLTGGNGPAAPRLRDVTLYYLPRNQAPSVAIRKPADGDAIAKDMLIQWTASDPDKDTLAYDVAYSKDGGQTWTPIKKRAGATKTVTKTVAATPASPAVIIAQGTTNLDKVPNLPPAVRAQILAQMKAEQLKAAAAPLAAPKPANKGAVELKETSFSWDTTEVPDGTYQVRVIASDKPSNPTDALTARAMSAPFLIANAVPTLTVQVTTGSLTSSDDTTIHLHGTVTTGPAFVKAVQAKIDGGDPVAASADDGLFDSPSEAWSLTLPPLPVGKHSVEVQAVDTAGNTVTQTVEVTSMGPGG